MSDHTREIVGLVASEEVRGELVDALEPVLAAAGFACVRLEVPTQAVRSLAQEPADVRAIVLCVQDTIACLSGLIEALGKRYEQAAIVVTCASVERREVRAALAVGAAGVVLHADLDSALIPCVRAALAGQLCVPRGHWRQVEPPVLSTREKQILSLVVMGYMNSQIAEQLFLAESTVKSHLSSAFGKLGVRSRNEAVDLILNPERGLGMGILGLGSEPLQPVGAAAK
jgi:DNA-binding NarL/FixJ family response regulator